MAALIAKQIAGGPGVLYNGFAPFLLRTLPQDALQFTVYSQVRVAPSHREPCRCALDRSISESRLVGPLSHGFFPEERALARS